jgi:tRNA 2-thiouridine synthesizing protein A
MMRAGEVPTAQMTVDTTGKFCPVPIIEVAKAIKAVQPGQVVQVVATDPGVESDMAAWCKATRNELLALVREGRTFRAFVRKT